MISKKRIRQLLLAALLVLMVIQFFQIDKTNPPVDTSKDFITNTNPPMGVALILKKACYDCHAHTTQYPWYTNVQPVAWWVKGHIDHGREHLNYSTWATYTDKKKAHKIEEMMEMVEGKEMPMLSYMVAHQDAWIDAEERKTLVDWFRSIQ